MVVENLSAAAGRLSTAECAHLVDDALGGTVLVHGSPPGSGRDLDLLARPPEREAVFAALRRAGFSSAGHTLVRFREGSVEQVELIPSEEWDLPEKELHDLYAEAVPIDGYCHLLRPSPAHTLLILARRVVEDIGFLDEKRRRYMDWALANDPLAWAHAEDLAEAWKAERPIELLQRLGGSGFVPLSVRAAVIGGRLRRSGRTRTDAWLEAGRQLTPDRLPPMVVSLSGLDGSGKSTQSRLLVDSLERIGISAATEWAKLGEDRRLWRVRRIGQRMVQTLRAARGASEREAAAGGTSEVVRAAESGSLLKMAWGLTAALSNAATLRLTVRRYRGRAQVLVFDRYVLDTVVHLEWRYGLDGLGLRFVRRIAMAAAPPSLRQYYLRIDPSVAQRRKEEDRVADLAAHAGMYEACLARPEWRHVNVLDAERPPEGLAAQIGTEVWEALHSNGRRKTLPRRLGGLLQRRARAAHS